MMTGRSDRLWSPSDHKKIKNNILNNKNNPKNLHQHAERRNSNKIKHAKANVDVLIACTVIRENKLYLAIQKMSKSFLL